MKQRNVRNSTRVKSRYKKLVRRAKLLNRLSQRDLIKSTLSLPICQNRNKRHLRNFRQASISAGYNMWLKQKRAAIGAAE